MRSIIVLTITVVHLKNNRTYFKHFISRKANGYWKGMGGRNGRITFLKKAWSQLCSLYRLSKEDVMPLDRMAAKVSGKFSEQAFEGIRYYPLKGVLFAWE